MDISPPSKHCLLGSRILDTVEKGSWEMLVIASFFQSYPVLNSLRVEIWVPVSVSGGWDCRFAISVICLSWACSSGQDPEELRAVLLPQGGNETETAVAL